jgi:hypothetical protein
MKKATNKATLYAFVGHNRGVARDFDGVEHRNEWVKTNLELGIDEVIEKLSWRAPDNQENANGESYGGWGSNSVVITRKDKDDLVGQLLTYCDAMFSDKEQKEAWKHIIKSTIHNWHDDKFNRFTLHEDNLKIIS